MYTTLDGKRAQIRFSNGQTRAADAPPVEFDDLAWFAQWSPDGTRVVVGEKLSAGIWNANDGRPLSPPLRHNGKNLVHCAFSPDGNLLATAAEDQTVRLWDGHTGRAINPPLLHSHVPLAISFSSDGARLATASIDRKSTRLNSSHLGISYAVFCLKKKSTHNKL